MKTNKRNDYENEAAIRLLRTACNEMCPFYKPTIHGNGTCIDQGEIFVRVKGRETLTIGENRIRKLISLFDEIGFVSLKECYEEGLAPYMATAVTSININGITESVRHQYGEVI